MHLRGSESASEEVAEKWEVGPTEDVVQALMEKLVDPRLPWKVSVTGPPSKETQSSVAKQMHAVVLLYNYYHRKQKPELRFLDFASFSKLAVVLRPRLISFMKLMKESKSMDLNGADGQLSVTEKAIKNACDIAVALDISKDVPNTEPWPIFKVAVLVVDPKKENCYLEFGLITEGVWSLIEKPLDESKIKADISMEEVIGTKRKWNDPSVSTVDSEFQLGYDAVKDATGFGNSNLVVLETHVVYSVCNLKSAARFFIMQCSQSFSIKNQVPLKLLVESLQGPLAEKPYGSWTATPVVEYYHMLPYADHISSWLSRKDLSLPSLNCCSAKIVTNNSEKEIKKSKIWVLPHKNFNDEELDHRDSDNCRPKANSFQKIVFDIKKFKQASCGNNKSAVNVFQKKENNGNGAEKFNQIHDILDSAKKPGKRVNLEVSDRKKDDLYEGLLSDSSIEIQRTSLNDLTTSFQESDDCRENLDSNLKVCYHRRKNVPFTRSDLHDSGGDFNLNECNSNESCHIETTEMNENVSGANGVLTVLCDQNGTAVTQNQQGLFHANTSFSADVQNFRDSEDVQNALSLIYRKRHELCAQMGSMEDTLAFYEDNIQRIREGGDVGLARQCIESILRGNYPSLLNHEIQLLNKGHHDTYFPGKSSCQDLEYTCLKNNWRLPRYVVEPSEGKFLSKVVVKSKDFKISSKGQLEFNPSDARESAAAQVIVKIRDQAAE
ncbi:uncharacterized protein LOC142518288 isoform X1 [Primulina tabacum]|uniref:uncharacterized protein LOC142518288 isoform X1 n=2 Tax=Primulina tabacum TaxID=48773 RepID=UPI003F5A39A5